MTLNCTFVKYLLTVGSMKIRMLRKWNNGLKDFVQGNVLEVSDGKAKELICDRIAEKYDGEYPPKDKMKTDLFKPKNIKKNVKS
jgi:hypothetical protein